MSVDSNSEMNFSQHIKSSVLSEASSILRAEGSPC